MKRLQILSVLCMLLPQYNLLAQKGGGEATPPPCLINPDFDHVPGPLLTNSSGCHYWNAGGVVNWTRSHGTPSITTFPNPIDNYVFLWGATGGNGFRGEGIYATFSCSANTSYTARIRVNVSDPANAGHFDLYCANGLTEPPINPFCGQDLPQIPSSQLFLITANHERNAGWRVYEYVFTPTSNFAQIWIFPYTASSTQYTLLVDYVKICRSECLGTTYYNNGQLPIGTTRRTNILIGSSAGTGGSGTVTVSATDNTTMIAGNQIALLPEFDASVTTGSFTCRIESCNGVFVERNQGNHHYEGIRNASMSNNRVGGPLLDSVSSDWLVKESANIYPNPSTGRFIINTGYVDNETVPIEVYDNSGRLVFRRTENLNSGKNLSLDLSGYKPGCYFIKIICRNETKTFKAFIVH